LGRKIEEALKLGATRILLQGGHNDDLPYSFYPEMISWISSNYPIEINAFSPSEIEQMEKVSGKSSLEILSELKAAGLKGLPGGGAEILDDAVRQRVSPKKIKTQRWLDIMEDAHSLDLTTTMTMVFGFGETFEQRLNHFERVRNVQDAAVQRGRRGFNAFVCWPLQHNENTSLGRSRHKSNYGASAMEYLRMISIARLFLDNIPNVQASWPTLGIEIAQVALQYGCNDIGSTMMEENVVSQAGAKSKDTWSLSPEELREAISDAGFIPAQRNSSFEILRTYE
jgi:cyclic dehypoxanthinyl futalosine synthase